MFKKIVLVILLLVAAIVVTGIYAKDVPFVKKTRETLQAQIQKLDDGPLGKQWDKVVAYFERLDKKANRKKAQASAMNTKCSPTPPPAPSGSCSKSPKTGITKSSSRQLWKDEKGVYNWKDTEGTFD